MRAQAARARIETPRREFGGATRHARASVVSFPTRLWGLPLEIRFLAFSIVVLVVGALVIGEWVSRTIERSVVDRTGEVAAVYVDGFVGPELQQEPFTGPLQPQTLTRLDGLLDTELGGGIVSFKVWSRDGVVRYATDPTLIGLTLQAGGGFSAALAGRSASHVSGLDEEENRYEQARWGELLETYAPIHSSRTGDVIAVAEFYQETDELLAGIGRSQRTAWIIVALATLVMFVALNSLVRSASRTIRQQTVRLQDLADRVRTVSTAKVQTDEAVLRRVSQDLHDGPAQDLALANLRMGALREAARGTSAAGDASAVATAVDRALRSVRRVSTEMRTPALDGLSVSDIVRRAAAEHEHRSGESVVVEAVFDGVIPRGATATTIYRVVSEALTNAARHAGPGLRRVRVDSETTGCTVTVEDQGVGFDLRATPEGLGRRGMRERAAVIGAHLVLRSTPGSGTTVELFLPEDTL
jgi:signal transduction histidine kinase